MPAPHSFTGRYVPEREGVWYAPECTCTGTSHPQCCFGTRQQGVMHLRCCGLDAASATGDPRLDPDNAYDYTREEWF